MSAVRCTGVFAWLNVVALLSAAPAFAGSTVFTDTDNDNNAHSGAADNDMDRLVGNGDGAHPIEFTLDVASVPTTSAVITVRAYDVDEEQGEVDELYLNDVFIGRLSGANNTWHASAFTIDRNLILPGENRVRVMVDTSGDATAWVVNVDWAQLVLDGGAGDGNTGAVRITGYSVAGPTITINTATTVTSVTGGNYRLEVSILDPNGQTSSVLSQDFAAAAGQTLTLNSSPTYALNGVSGTYTVQAQLFFIVGGFPVQQDFDVTQFVHSQNVGVTDADADGLTNTQEQTLGTDPLNRDTDGDGVPDGTEVGNVASPTDTDGDGISNALESTLVDTDGDGVNNQLDPANTNPCIPNANSSACLAFDSDGDGLSNGQEDAIGTSRSNPDTDGDGINDGVEVGGNPAAPIDTDGDGVPDALESGTSDSDNDGLANSSDPDSDNDGIPDSVEHGTVPGVFPDTDGDGVPNYLDRDSDNDGVPDALESGPTPATPIDTDGDGQPDYLDTDSDGDGLSDTIEGNASGVDTDGDDIDDAFDVDTLGGSDANHDGIDDAAVLPDTDGDGSPDLRDLDTDGDGLTDSVEGNVDTDGDGVPDFRDLDSDNDGVLDVNESGLVDADGDGLLDAGQTPVSVAPDSDGDGAPDFRDLDSNNDGTNDIVTGGFGSLDPNGDGRIDATADTDGDGIPNVRDSAPLVPGNAGDADNDGVPDTVDLDIDNDGIPNDADGSDDTDGDGRPNYADLDSDNDGIADVIEAGGVDANGDGRVDNFVDTNHNGLADSVESVLGGTPLPLPDTDHDGADNHRDIDSDGDGISDLVESGGTDGNGDGHVDSPADVNHDGLADALESSMTGGHAVAPVDTDGDHTRDYLDLDSDGDGIEDAREGSGDSDHDGIADFRDTPGKLATAVSGAGAFDLKWLALLLGVVVMRLNWTRGIAVRRVSLVVLLAATGASALSMRAEAAGASGKDEGFYAGFDIGQSRLEPEDNGGGYEVSDKSGTAWRVLGGYRFSPHWSAELWYVDAGEAGISSDNPAVGELGAIEYRLFGGGAEWAPLGEGRESTFFPVLKTGFIQTTNERTDDRINYERQHHTGVYFGVGAGWNLTRMWAAQADLMSYDKDELVLSIGVRANF